MSVSDFDLATMSPTSRAVYDHLRDNPGHTRNQIMYAVRRTRGSVDKACEWLVKRGLIKAEERKVNGTLQYEFFVLLSPRKAIA